MKKYKVWTLLILCNLFWAGNYVFGSYVVTEMSPVWITFSRWVLALFILFPIAYLLEKPKLQAIKKSWHLLLIMGILGTIGYNLILYSALSFTSATNAALVSALNPGVIVLFSVFLLREKLTRVQGIGFLTSLAGALLILTEGKIWNVFHASYNTGDLLMIGAVIIWTLYSIIGRRVKIPPITATAVSTLFGMILLAPFALTQPIDLSSLSSLAFTGILYMVIFSSVGSFIFWNISVREIGASQAGIFLNLIPVFTAVISLALGDRITLEQILGGILVFIGVYLTTGMLEQRMKQNKETKSVA
ncbi:DMT family transporter [Bacillus sp. FJAT-45350]|uniref:DMT family transporter n=1 Tax=Bacillus sp. FJAT-45350 TaxID=2011014 RepID=UPI000BB91490|nr:DMT family transporter [Bacillus sp. FJAT-45350]